MALTRFVITAPVVIPAGTATVVSGGFGTVSWAGASGVYAEGVGPGAIEDAYASQSDVTLLAGTPIILDNAGGANSLYAYLNAAGVLRPYVQGQDDVGHAALSN